MRKEFYKKGSTLLLAMVIISTVLFAGIGVATILSKQIKETINIRNEVIAFYVAETVADMMRDGDLEQVSDCNNLNFGEVAIECTATKTEQEYHIIIKVYNDYYRFVKEIDEEGSNGGGGESEDTIKVYFQDPGWATPKARYHFYFENGNMLNVYKSLSPSSFDGWLESGINADEYNNVTHVRIYLCQEENDTGCRDRIPTSTEHGGWEEIGKITTPICRYSDDKLDRDIPCVNPDTISLYFKKPLSWGDLVMSTYWVYYASPTYINELMSESSYPDWMSSSVNLSSLSIAERLTRFMFCEGENQCSGTLMPAEWIRWGIFCVDGSSVVKCYYPGSNY